jgi:diguanylate cyclase (GGDEF)-like protein
VIPGSTAKINALNTQAWELREWDADQARRLAEEALDLASGPEAGEAPYPRGAAQALVILGELANSQDAYGLALSHLLKAYALLQNLPDQEMLADASHTIGWAQYRLGNHTEAANFLRRSLSIYRQLGLQDKESSVLSTQGLLNSAEGKHTQALDLYKKALRLHAGQGFTRSWAVALNNVALTQIHLEMYDEALANAQKALDMIRQLGLSTLEASILDTIGQVYLARVDLHLAEEALQQSLAVSRRSGNEHGEMTALLTLGQVFSQAGMAEAARQVLARELELAEARQLNSFRYRCYEQLARVCEQQGEFQPALQYYKTARTVKELALAEAAHYRLENLKVLHQVEKARRDAEMLWVHNRALESEIHSSRHDHAELEKLATTDPLTRLFNRQHFITLGEYELEKALRVQQTMLLILLEIDHFEGFITRFGHDVGDLALIAIARTLVEHVRKGDVCCRYGRGEFIILLPDTDLETGLQVAQRICKAAESSSLQVGVQAVSMTVNLGVAQSTPQDTCLESMLARVKQALYRARAEGRARQGHDAHNDQPDDNLQGVP